MLLMLQSYSYRKCSVCIRKLLVIVVVRPVSLVISVCFLHVIGRQTCSDPVRFNSYYEF